MQSLAEENYLKAIYKLTQIIADPSVSTQEIAREVGTRPASVTSMLRKLARKGLVDHQKYYGVRLTRDGQAKALDLIRKHRLWEVFLAEKLGFAWDQVHDLAEQLEHVGSSELVERLDRYLGNPRFDPHGDPIPNELGRFTLRSQRSLAAISDPGHTYTLVGVRLHEPQFLRYLSGLRLQPGAEFEILSIQAYDRSYRLQIPGSEPVWISHQTAQELFVKS
ncbi:MAG: metal-dependent transcriptional regulator [Saprospiraceae bacterium]|nr:metal-dependent transcriptional regulator [Saprospiraceae bacterium]